MSVVQVIADYGDYVLVVVAALALVAEVVALIWALLD